MRNKYRVLFIVLSLILALTSAVLTQKGNTWDQLVNPNATFNWNDQLVLNAMRNLHSAEMTYRSTTGNGNYGTLQSLQQAELIDAMMAAGQKHGYRFTLTIRHASATMQPGFELTATPIVRRVRSLSFYMNESCDVRGAERFGRDASINDPVVEPCGTSLRTENESYSIASLRDIHNAQITYQATYGAGQFGTPAQLYDADLVTTGFVNSHIWRGYAATFTATPATATMPARFTVSIVPTQYSRTGIRSFYIDETGVLRGGDKNGDTAGPSDPPVNN